MLLRTVCGLGLIGAALVAGVMLRSPWTVATLGLVFSVLFVIGKWDEWKHALASSSRTDWCLGLLSVIPTQCVIVGVFYGAGFGVGKLGNRARPMAAFEGWDAAYAATVLVLGVGLALAAHILEARAMHSGDALLSMLESDDELPDEMKKLVLKAQKPS